MSKIDSIIPTTAEIEKGICLPSLKDERFCLLIVRGTPPCEASKIAYPNNKNHGKASVSERLSRNHINQRIEFLRNEIAMRTTISLAHKRDLLAKMAIGEIPTETIKLPGGKSIQKFQPLSAIKYDAKLSGEEAAKKIDVMGTGLKLSFVMPDRNGQFTDIETTSIKPSLPQSIFEEAIEEIEDVKKYNEPSLSFEDETPQEASSTVVGNDVAKESTDSFATAYENSIIKNLEQGTSKDYDDTIE